MTKSLLAFLFSFGVLAIGLLSPVSAQQHPSHISGFGSGRLTEELRVEDELVSHIRPDTLRSLVSALSSEIHVAGTAAQARTRDIVMARMQQAGLTAKVYSYDVYLPHAKHASLEMVAPTHKSFTLEEQMLPGEKKGAGYPWVNGYSAAGDVTAGLVYVNYGLHEDYHDLDSLGISVKGKIAIARYGKSYRGIKAMLAELHGAAGLIIFTDPSGDGYDAGDVIPKGPMRPGDGVQRGSVYNGHGDPTSPDGAAVQGAKHLPFDSAKEVPHIPVIPISYAIAKDLLEPIGGLDVPNGQWQGGLAFRYHIGDGRERVRITVELEKPQLSTICNTVVEIPGSVWPDEWVIAGGHRDAWCYGAEDNVAGASSVVAAAEACGDLLRTGWRPKRSIRFITWDAEEWGLIGSTEWVKQFERELSEKAVLYINQDMCATGATFDASSDPVLYPLIYEAAAAIVDPKGGSVYDQWAKHSRNYASDVEPKPSIGFLGGGSDFSGFYNHLGIPSAEHGFSGPFGQYHSNHDNIDWTLHHGDSTFAYHAASSQLLALEAVRVADADALPFDFAALAEYLHTATYGAKIRAFRAFGDDLGFPLLDSAIDSFKVVSNAFTRAREEKVLSEGSTWLRDNTKLEKLNDAIRGVYRALMTTDGLSFDRYVHNPLVSSDPDNGYADLRLPGIELGLRHRDGTQLRHEVEVLTRLVRAATAKLLEAQVLIG